MDKSEKDEVARELRRQREILFTEMADTDADLGFIAEDRESEIEERAQEELASRLLSRLSDRGKRQLEEIDAALERIAADAFGNCQGCGGLIALQRLRALPATRFCIACASEKETPAIVPLEEPLPKGRLFGELSVLTDPELRSLILDLVREDGRVDREELRVVCRHGVVYLDGVLPSAAEHSILLQLLEDVVGIQEVVDRIQVEELLWEREDRAKEEQPELLPPEEIPPRKEPYGTEDIVESEEQGTDYVPPLRPMPEEE
ncbi:MAG: TraR/DksA C4-type zinc finger protein [Deltaproteobacteria bacterium]|nr:TraR/DksA C4-type zinc finger protein [Deltaproteobacteria bacterium]